MRASVCFIVVSVALAYDEKRAIQYAKLSGAAYCSENSLKSWSCGDKCISGISNVQVCKGASTKAFVSTWEGSCLVSFEGTSNIASAIADLEFLKKSVTWNKCSNCRLHGGFLDEWNSLEKCVKTELASVGCPAGKSIRLTGHSLGAALSGIAGVSLSSDGWKVVEHYNFGMPRTGDANFAKAFNSLGGEFYRVTHHEDPVVQLPPDELIIDWHFEHVEPEIFYNGDVSKGHVGCSVADDKKCSGQYWNLPIDALHIPDHLDYMGTETSTSDCKSGDIVVV